MSDDSKSKPSFSAASRWWIGIDKVVRTILVLAVVGMMNYLAAKYFHRFHWSSQTQTALSQYSLNVLRSLTNQVTVTLYYDRHEDFYPDIVALLNEYRAANHNISVQTVDYNRDPGQAQIIKQKYEQYFESASNTNLVIFDCPGRLPKILPGDKLTRYKTKLVGSRPRADNPQLRDLEFERQPVDFNGEQAFTSVLLSLANPSPLKAYFLHGHGEVSLTDAGQRGYMKLVSILQENYVDVAYLDSIGNTPVPMDCNLLVIAGPSHAFDTNELQQISRYLNEGGRLFALFNWNGSQVAPTGLEGILQNWGVGVEDDVVQDFSRSTTTLGYDMYVDQFGNHPVVNSLSQLQLLLYLPRPILKLPPAKVADAPQVDELFASSPSATLMVNRNQAPHQYPLACAVEQKPVAGVSKPRGNTRIIVVGDATFLGNAMIDMAGNRDFLNAAINWLGDRPMLLAGIGPRPVTNFRLVITQLQQRQLDWLLLGALPGGVLFFGWLVWLVRRK